MVKKKKIKQEDELDDDLDFEGEDEDKESFCVQKVLMPWVWVLGVMVVVVVVFALFSKNVPSSKEIAEAWGEPEKTVKLFSHQVAQGSQIAAFSWGGRLYKCPNCGWQGTRLGINSNGNHICPQCFYSPFQRYGTTGQGIAAITTASPQVVLIKQVGMEVIDTQRGVLVAQVYRNSWAEKGRLKHGDIIVRFNHKRVGSTAQFKKIVQSAPSERRVRVKVSRLGKIVKLNVMIGEGEMEGVILPGQTQGGVGAAWGQGNIAYVVCPNCGFKMLHHRGGVTASSRCPKCGSMMVREEILNQGAQVQRPWFPQ